MYLRYTHEAEAAGPSSLCCAFKQAPGDAPPVYLKEANSLRLVHFVSVCRRCTSQVISGTMSQRIRDPILDSIFFFCSCFSRLGRCFRGADKSKDRSEADFKLVRRDERVEGIVEIVGDKVRESVKPFRP